MGNSLKRALNADISWCPGRVIDSSKMTLDDYDKMVFIGFGVVENLGQDGMTREGKSRDSMYLAISDLISSNIPAANTERAFCMSVGGDHIYFCAQVLEPHEPEDGWRIPLPPNNLCMKMDITSEVLFKKASGALTILSRPDGIASANPASVELDDAG